MSGSQPRARKPSICLLAPLRHDCCERKAASLQELRFCSSELWPAIFAASGTPWTLPDSPWLSARPRPSPTGPPAQLRLLQQRQRLRAQPQDVARRRPVPAGGRPAVRGTLGPTVNGTQGPAVRGALGPAVKGALGWERPRHPRWQRPAAGRVPPPRSGRRGPRSGSAHRPTARRLRRLHQNCYSSPPQVPLPPGEPQPGSPALRPHNHILSAARQFRFHASWHQYCPSGRADSGGAAQEAGSTAENPTCSILRTAWGRQAVPWTLHSRSWQHTEFRAQPDPQWRCRQPAARPACLLHGCGYVYGHLQCA